MTRRKTEYPTFAKPDALIAACHHLNREWGTYGYTIEGVDSPVFGHARLHVVHSDGSRFTIEADQHGNILPSFGTAERDTPRHSISHPNRG